LKPVADSILLIAPSGLPYFDEDRKELKLLRQSKDCRGNPSAPIGKIPKYYSIPYFLTCGNKIRTFHGPPMGLEIVAER
jgi:hypothetical protein